MTIHINIPPTMLVPDHYAPVAAEWDAQVQRERRNLETALGYSVSCLDDSLRALLNLIDFEDPQFTRTDAGRDAQQHLRNSGSSLRDAIRCITAPSVYPD
ncbi:hypothetical protein [Kribbella sp. NPDC048928]|uniref:hypothetical protein n=1 Tax=Kribbella sp. NPDC048928 TaxID=3364111 RepID=UPI003722D0CD